MTEAKGRFWLTKAYYSGKRIGAFLESESKGYRAGSGKGKGKSLELVPVPEPAPVPAPVRL